MLDEEECGGSSRSNPEGEMYLPKWCHNLELKCRYYPAAIPQLRVPQVTSGCQRTLLMAHYNFCGGPLIPAHIQYKSRLSS